MKPLLSRIKPPLKGKSEDAFKKVFQSGIDISHLPYSLEYPHRYRLQGFCTSSEYLFLSAHGQHGDPSILLVYSKSGEYVRTIELPSTLRYAHVGGISYDPLHDVLFIMGMNGEVLALKESGIIGRVCINDVFPLELAKYYYAYYHKKKEHCPYRFSTLLRSFSKIKRNAASVKYEPLTKKLYISTFSGDSQIFVYKVSFNPCVSFRLEHIYGLSIKNSVLVNDTTNLPYAIQGVGIYGSYLVTCSSYGKRDTILTKFKMEDKKLIFSGYARLVGEYGLQNMMMDSKGNIVLNYENCSYGKDGSQFYTIHIDSISKKMDATYQSLMNEYKKITIPYDKKAGYFVNEDGDLDVSMKAHS